eukprot:PhF_6_TR15905/c0_g1_i1/m.24521
MSDGEESETRKIAPLGRKPTTDEEDWACKRIQARLRAKRSQADFQAVKAQGLSVQAMSYMKQKREALLIDGPDDDSEVAGLRQGTTTASSAMKGMPKGLFGATMKRAWKLMKPDLVVVIAAWILTCASTVMMFFAPQFTLLAFRLVFYKEDGQIRLEEFVILFVAYSSVVTVATFFGRLTWKTASISWGERVETLLLVLASRNPKLMRKIEMDSIRKYDLENSKRILFFSLPKMWMGLCSFCMGLGMALYQSYPLGLLIFGICFMLFLFGSAYDNFVQNQMKEYRFLKDQETEQWAYLKSHDGEKAMKQVMELNQFKRSFTIKKTFVHLFVGGLYRLCLFLAPIFYMYLGGELVKKRWIQSQDIVFCIFYFLYCLVATASLNTSIVDMVKNVTGLAKLLLLIPQTDDEIEEVMARTESVEASGHIEGTLAEPKGSPKRLGLLIVSLLVLGGVVFFVVWVGLKVKNSTPKLQDLPAVSSSPIPMSPAVVATSTITTGQKRYRSRSMKSLSLRDAAVSSEDHHAKSLRSHRPTFSEQRAKHVVDKHHHAQAIKRSRMMQPQEAAPSDVASSLTVPSRFVTCVDDVPTASAPCQRPFNFLFKLDASGKPIITPANVNFQILQRNTKTIAETSYNNLYVTASLVVEQADMYCRGAKYLPGDVIVRMQCLIDSSGRGLCANFFKTVACAGRYGIRLVLPPSAAQPYDPSDEDYAIVWFQSYTLPAPLILPQPMPKWVREAKVSVSCPNPPNLLPEQIQVRLVVERDPGGRLFEGIIGNNNMLPTSVLQTWGSYRVTAQCIQDPNAVVVSTSTTVRSDTTSIPTYDASYQVIGFFEMQEGPPVLPPPAVRSDVSDLSSTMPTPPVRIFLDSNTDDITGIMLFYSLSGEEGSLQGAPKLKSEVMYDPAIGITLKESGHFTVWAQSKKEGFTPSSITRFDIDIDDVTFAVRSRNVCPKLSYSCKLLGIPDSPEGFFPVVKDLLAQDRIDGSGVPTSLPCSPIGGDIAVMRKCQLIIEDQWSAALAERLFFSPDPAVIEAHWDRWDGVKRIKQTKFKVVKDNLPAHAQTKQIVETHESVEKLASTPAAQYRLVMMLEPCSNFNGKERKVDCEVRSAMCEWADSIERCLDKPCELLGSDKFMCESSSLLCKWTEVVPGANIGLCTSRLCHELDDDHRCEAHDCVWDNKLQSCFNKPCETKLRAVDCKLPCVFLGQDITINATNIPQSQAQSSLEKASSYDPNAGKCVQPSCGFFNQESNIERRRSLCEESHCSFNVDQKVCTYHNCYKQEDMASCFHEHCLWVARPTAQSTLQGVTEFHCIQPNCGDFTNAMSECIAFNCAWNNATNVCQAPALSAIRSAAECDGWGQQWVQSQQACAPRPCLWDQQTSDLLAPRQNYPLCKSSETPARNRRGIVSCSAITNEVSCSSTFDNSIPLCEWKWNKCSSKPCYSYGTKSSCGSIDGCQWAQPNPVPTITSQVMPTDAPDPCSQYNDQQSNCASQQSCMVKVIQTKDLNGNMVPSGWMCAAQTNQTVTEQCFSMVSPCSSPCSEDPYRKGMCTYVPSQTVQISNDENNGVCVPPSCDGMTATMCNDVTSAQHCQWDSLQNKCVEAACNYYTNQESCALAYRWAAPCTWVVRESTAQCEPLPCNERDASTCMSKSRGQCVWSPPSMAVLGLPRQASCRSLQCWEFSRQEQCAMNAEECRWDVAYQSCARRTCLEIQNREGCRRNPSCSYSEMTQKCDFTYCNGRDEQTCATLDQCEAVLVSDVSAVIPNRGVSVASRFTPTSPPAGFASYTHPPATNPSPSSRSLLQVPSSTNPSIMQYDGTMNQNQVGSIVYSTSGIAPQSVVCRRRSCNSFQYNVDACLANECSKKMIYNAPTPFWRCVESCSRMRSSQDCSATSVCAWDATNGICVRAPCDTFSSNTTCEGETIGCTWDSFMLKCKPSVSASSKAPSSREHRFSTMSAKENKNGKSVLKPIGRKHVKAIEQQQTLGGKHHSDGSVRQKRVHSIHHHTFKSLPHNAIHRRRSVMTFRSLAVEKSTITMPNTPNAAPGVSDPNALLPLSGSDRQNDNDKVTDPTKDVKKLDVSNQNALIGQCDALAGEIRRKVAENKCESELLLEAARQHCDLSSIFPMDKTDFGTDAPPLEYYYVRCLNEFSIPADQEFNYLSQGSGRIVVASPELVEATQRSMESSETDGDIRDVVELPVVGQTGYIISLLLNTPLQNGKTPERQGSSGTELPRNGNSAPAKETLDVQSDIKASVTSNPDLIKQLGQCTSDDCRQAVVASMMVNGPSSANSDPLVAVTSKPATGSKPASNANQPSLNPTAQASPIQSFPSDSQIRSCLKQHSLPLPDRVNVGSIVLVPLTLQKLSHEPISFIRALVVDRTVASSGDVLWDVVYVPPMKGLSSKTINFVSREQRNQVIPASFDNSTSPSRDDVGAPEVQAVNPESSFYADITSYFTVPRRKIPSRYVIPLRPSYLTSDSADGQAPIPDTRVLFDDKDMPVIPSGIAVQYRLAECLPANQLFEAVISSAQPIVYRGSLTSQDTNVYYLHVRFNDGQCVQRTNTQLYADPSVQTNFSRTQDPSKALLTGIPVKSVNPPSPADVIVVDQSNLRVAHKVGLSLDRDAFQQVKVCAKLPNFVDGTPTSSTSNTQLADGGNSVVSAPVLRHKARHEATVMAKRKHAEERRARVLQAQAPQATYDPSKFRPVDTVIQMDAGTNAPITQGTAVGAPGQPLIRTSSVAVDPAGLNCASLASKSWIQYITGDTQEIPFRSHVRCEVDKSLLSSITDTQPQIIGWVKGEEILVLLHQSRTLADGRTVYPVFRHNPSNEKELLDSGVYITADELGFQRLDDDSTVRFSFHAPGESTGIESFVVRIGRDPGVLSEPLHLVVPNVQIEDLSIHWDRYDEYRIDFDTDVQRGVVFNYNIQDPVFVFFTELPDNHRPPQTPGTGPKGIGFSGTRYFVADASFPAEVRRGGGGRLFTPVMHIPHVEEGQVVLGFAYYYYGNAQDMPTIRVLASTTFGFDWIPIVGEWPPKDWSKKPKNDVDSILQDRWRFQEVSVTRFQGQDVMFAFEVVWKIEPKAVTDGEAMNYIPNQGDVGFDDIVVRIRRADYYPTTTQPLIERFADVPNQHSVCSTDATAHKSQLKLPEGWGSAIGLSLSDLAHLSLNPPVGIGKMLPTPDDSWDIQNDRLFVADAVSCPQTMNYVESPVIKLDSTNPMQLTIRTLQSGAPAVTTFETRSTGEAVEKKSYDRSKFSVFSIEINTGDEWRPLPGVTPWSGIPDVWAVQIVDLSLLRNSLIRFRFAVRTGSDHSYPSLIALPQISRRVPTDFAYNLNQPSPPPMEPCGTDEPCCARWRTEAECSRKEYRGCRWKPQPDFLCTWTIPVAMQQDPEVKAEWVVFNNAVPQSVPTTTVSIPIDSFSRVDQSIGIRLTVTGTEWSDLSLSSLSSLFDGITTSKAPSSSVWMKSFGGGMAELRSAILNNVTQVSPTEILIRLPYLNSLLSFPNGMVEDRLYVIVDANLVTCRNELMSNSPLRIYLTTQNKREGDVAWVEPNTVTGRSLGGEQPIVISIVFPGSLLSRMDPQMVLKKENFDVTCVAPEKCSPSSIFHQRFGEIFRDATNAISYIRSPGPSVVYSENGTSTPVAGTTGPEVIQGFQLKLLPVQSFALDHDETVCLRMLSWLPTSVCFTIQAVRPRGPELNPTSTGQVFHGSVRVFTSMPKSALINGPWSSISVELSCGKSSQTKSYTVLDLEQGFVDVRACEDLSPIATLSAVAVNTDGTQRTEPTVGVYTITPILVTNVIPVLGCREFTECTVLLNGVAFNGGNTLDVIETSLVPAAPNRAEFSCGSLPFDVRRGVLGPMAIDNNTNMTIPSRNVTFEANVAKGRTPGDYALCVKPNFLGALGLLQPQFQDNAPWVFVGIVKVAGFGASQSP